MTKKEVNKNRKQRKILLAIIMLLFTGIVLSASTYAWFTANRTVTVESIDVNVSTSEGLQISTDAVDWKSIVTNADITGASWNGVKNQLPDGGNGKYAVPVSTVGNVAEGYMEMYKGTVETDEGTAKNYLSSVKSVEKNGNEGDFVAFDLFFQSAVAQKVYLTSNSKVVAKDGTTSTGIENAARVAFIKNGSVGYGSSAQQAQELKGNELSLIWEPNMDTHTPAAINNAQNIYGVTIGANHPKITYKGVKAEFTMGEKVELTSQDTAKFGDVTTVGTPSTGIPTNKYQEAFEVAEGVTKIRIYLWVEGQDYDCEDKASGGNISYNLQFSIDQAA